MARRVQLDTCVSKARSPPSRISCPCTPPARDAIGRLGWRFSWTPRSPSWAGAPPLDTLPAASGSSRCSLAPSPTPPTSSTSTTPSSSAGIQAAPSPSHPPRSPANTPSSSPSHRVSSSATSEAAMGPSSTVRGSTAAASRLPSAPLCALVASSSSSYRTLRPIARCRDASRHLLRISATTRSREPLCRVCGTVLRTWLDSGSTRSSKGRREPARS